MKSNFGIIVIGEIVNNMPSRAVKWILLKENSVKFVHYPDCQQLIIWLPQPGREYGMLRIWNTKSSKLVEEWPVTDKLSGSVQLIWDTLPLPPGSYRIGIDWKNETVHLVALIKHKKGVPAKVEAALPVTESKAQKKELLEYKDGFGKPVPNEDIMLREKLVKDLNNKFGRKIEYEGNLRAGTIIYSDPFNRIVFSHEMGGGNCMFYIEVPKEEYWEARTKTSLDMRNEILEYVATRVQAEQASNCRYEINADTINFYYK